LETLKDYLLQGPPLFPSPRIVKVNDDELSDLSKFEHLQVLDLCAAEITNKALLYIKDLKNLQVLDLRKTRVNDEGLKLLEQHNKNLKKLYLTWCPVTNKGLEHVGKLPNLEVLVLGRTPITDAGVMHLAGLR
jgi:hypothetical protein